VLFSIRFFNYSEEDSNPESKRLHSFVTQQVHSAPCDQFEINTFTHQYLRRHIQVIYWFIYLIYSL